MNSGQAQAAQDWRHNTGTHSPPRPPGSRGGGETGDLGENIGMWFKPLAVEAMGGKAAMIFELFHALTRHCSEQFHLHR